MSSGASCVHLSLTLGVVLVASSSVGLEPLDDQCDAAWALPGRGGMVVQLDSPEASSQSVGQRLSAGLEGIDLERDAKFGLFRGIPRAAGPVSGEGGFALAAGGSGLQGDIYRGSNLSASLLFSANADRVPEGLRLSFKGRTFSDLDPWEKAGYVLRQASAVAGVAYLLYRILE